MNIPPRKPVQELKRLMINTDVAEKERFAAYIKKSLRVLDYWMTTESCPAWVEDVAAAWMRHEGLDWVLRVRLCLDEEPVVFTVNGKYERLALISKILKEHAPSPGAVTCALVPYENNQGQVVESLEMPQVAPDDAFNDLLDDELES